QLASLPAWKVGDELSVSWSLSGHLQGITARVLGLDPETCELILQVGRGFDDVKERRGVSRFPLHAEALLVIDGVELAGRAFDVSVLGAGLVLGTPGPEKGARGELLLHDAGQPLLPGATVRVAFVHSDAPGLMRVGVEYDDPKRCVDATVRLLAAIDAY